MDTIISRTCTCTWLLQLPRGAAKRKRKCDKCEHDSHWRCEQCKTFLCHACYAKHAADDTCRYHVTSEAGDDEELRIDRPVFCDVHQQQRITKNCRSCETCVCDTCLSDDGGHIGHVTEAIDDACKRLEPIYEQYAEALEEDVNILQQEIQHLERLATRSTDPAEKEAVDEGLEKKRRTLHIYRSLADRIRLVLTRSCDEFKVHELQSHVRPLLQKHYYDDTQLSDDDDERRGL